MRPSRSAASRSSAISSPSWGRPTADANSAPMDLAHKRGRDLHSSLRAVIQVVIRRVPAHEPQERHAQRGGEHAAQRAAAAAAPRELLERVPHRASKNAICFCKSEALRPTRSGWGTVPSWFLPLEPPELNPAATPFRLITDASRRDRAAFSAFSASASARRAASMSRRRRALGFETHSLADAEQDLVQLVQALEGSLRRGPLLGRVLVRVRAQRAPPRSPRSPRAPTPSRPAEDPPARRPGGPPRRPSPTSPRDSAASASSRISR